MRPLAELQGEFAAALLDPRRPAPVECVDPEGCPDAQRFAVYRNNVVSSLIEALEAAYPAIRRLVGEEFFRATAREYVLQDPPRSPVMLHYGEGFPAFLAHFGPLDAFPYLADVARIERSWLDAYHAAEAEPLDPAVLANIPGNRVADLRLLLHPSVRLVRSPFPALTIWQANAPGRTMSPVDVGGGAQDVLIARPAAEVQLRLMPPGGAHFVDAVALGATLAEACACASAACTSFDLTTHLGLLLESGLVTGARLRRRRPASQHRKTPACHRISQ